MANNKLQLVWLRSDLRSRDNPALYQASLKGPVICVWCSFEEQWLKHNDSPNKLRFWQENLNVLKKNLEVFNIPLITKRLKRFSDTADSLLQLAKKIDCEAIWFNDEYGANEHKRDQNIKAVFDKAGIGCFSFTGDCLMTPGSVLNKEGSFFKVFTPFRKAVYQNISPSDYHPCPAPKKQEPPSLNVKSDKLPAYKPTAENILETWPAGEKNAHKILKAFIEERADGYKKNRDFPAKTGTSSLSVYLTAGVLSIRQCFEAAAKANDGELDTGCAGLACWMSELIWREFYRHILVGFPRVSMSRAFQKHTEQIPWKTDKQLLKAWQEGKTGYPIVDAAMRQLVATGWMHNRLRMICAMFFTKDLMLDWRLGEKFFMEHLIDGDLASNNGGWQWSASTGTDAAPYFRIFNPASQSAKFDPDGVFLREWLPELKNLDGKSIHTPSSGKHDLLGSNPDYPEPIIDHNLARTETLGTFKSLKK
ncbi:deoxyribodipyrimidine photo-lyase [Sansalvadorimonas sp. 2012CJ34-2]|uniref:Deoxyribodipyrimidine photo-lyase n=1 Tax=Parendozoicomonas callyspongiae TaxID=2942213 RepID=A0ABT0PJD3_9GAMM|nr:deoxyribodipyrimidine photo-lyase [Sansalvadorimonas sp. 2012CJ34-2]MCL6271497.1 deoxyribodipyrimidine photo-lyase [Sansalvadorimonas sp. 2012CJ34-2]